MHLLIDTHYLMHRVLNTKSYQNMRTTDGRLTGGVYGVLKSLHSSFGKFATINKCTAVFDSGYSQRRKSLSAEYKSNRVKANPTEEEVAYRRNFNSQKVYVKYILGKLGCRVLELQGKEADDILFWLTRNIPGRKVVMSDDRDILQCVCDGTVVYRPLADQIANQENFQKIAKFKYESYLAARAMIGDPADCIHGVKGVGEKTAQAIFNEVTTLEEAVQLCSKSKKKAHKAVVEKREHLELNMKLLDLSMEEFSEEEVAFINRVLGLTCRVGVNHAIEFFKTMQFHSMLGKDLVDFARWAAPFHLLS